MERIDKVLMNPVISGSDFGAVERLFAGIFFNYDNIRFCGVEVANYNSLKVTAEPEEAILLPKSEIENG